MLRCEAQQVVMLTSQILRETEEGKNKNPYKHLQIINSRWTDWLPAVLLIQINNHNHQTIASTIWPSFMNPQSSKDSYLLSLSFFNKDWVPLLTADNT